LISGPVSEIGGHATIPASQPDHPPNRLSKAGAGVAVVAGVGEGIGGSIARRAAAEGFTTVMVARNLERLRCIAAGIEHAGGSAHACAVDLRVEADVAKLFDDVVAQFGTPSLVVFNAGAQRRESILDTTGSMFEKVWRLNCLAGFFVAREAARHMVREQRGTILFTGATASLRGANGFAAFASAKCGLRALAQSMARELGPAGIHVANIIVDGPVDMPAIHELFPDLAAGLPEDGMIKPADIADTYLWLHTQPRSAWSFEIDLRPWAERF
jgi:NAD(P)-dependent dehydrogenase (short-subunit alcohol dehydrogenase family)